MNKKELQQRKQELLDELAQVESALQEIPPEDSDIFKNTLLGKKEI